MSRERRTKAIILKKQPYGEGDEIVTFFSEELGKLRLIAKASKKTTSKLQYALQNFSVVEIRFQDRADIPKLFQAVPLEVFSAIYEDEQKIFFLFWFAELTLKGTADSQPNSNLYHCLLTYIRFVSSPDFTRVSPGVLKTKASLDFLAAFGLGVNVGVKGELFSFFSNASGGFSLVKTRDSREVEQEDLDIVRQLVFMSPRDIILVPSLSSKVVLIIREFLRYQMDRTVNSERFLNITSHDII